MTGISRNSSRAFEVALFVIAAICLQWYAYVKIETARVRHAVADAVTVESGPVPATAPTTPPAPPRDDIQIGGPVGILSVPRLQLSTAVVEGDEDVVLDVSAGHLPDTPWPWETGNAAIAAHRDGLFRGLRHVKAGDAIELKTTHGDLQYRVTDIRIVLPTDVSVLDAGERDSLTLITCYPFYYVGHAPKRFIVRAERTAPPSPARP